MDFFSVILSAKLFTCFQFKVILRFFEESDIKWELYQTTNLKLIAHEIENSIIY